MDEKEYVELRGTVEQIVFSNEENGYAVLRLLSQEGAEITATGTFPGIGLGEELTMVGCWVMHPSYGEQFSAEHFERRLPTTVRGIADYLSSGLIRGIGPRLGARIAEKFGEDTFDVMLNEPERLTEIKGITSRRAKEIARQYVEQSAMRELMDFLSEHGLPIEITALLYKRFKHFNGDPTKGLCIICCELIENNGSTLHEYVIRHAEYHKLGQDFIDWVENSCHFCDTLVDRIVPGFPREQIGEIREEIGYDDNLVVKAELYHLWAIGGPGYKEVMKELPLDKAGLHVIFMPSIKQFRDKKVRILNGSHTGMVPIALQMGCETVMDAFNTPDIERFVNDMVAEEVIPMIDEDRDELKKFAAGILERFYNPFIKHMLRSISLNSLSKWEARNYPTVRDNWFKAQRLAEREAFTFAALMTLYGPNSGFEPDDTREFVDYICANWDSADMEATIAKIVKESGIFTVDFSEVPGFIGTVAGYVRDIETLGMKDALKKFLGA